MRKIMLSVMWIALCLVVIAGSGIAQSLHDKADTDKDGIVSGDELKKALDERYRNEDADKDGKMTVEEYQKAREKNFSEADRDKDGSVTVSEWVVYWCGTDKGAEKVTKPRAFGREASRKKLMDANKDGKVTKNECVAFWAGRFVDLDANKDGRMSRDEYLERMKGMAKIMDLNGDGVITVEEYYISWVGKEKPKGKPAVKKTPAEKAPAKQ